MKELEVAMSDPDFWLDRGVADAKIREHGELNELIGKFEEVDKEIEELDSSDLVSPDWQARFFEVRRKFRQIELETLFSGPYDKRAAVLGFYPGAGGEDAADWARMLFEMYSKYAERQGWKVSTIDDNPNRRTVEIRGNYAYGYLKRESGVHRLVRMSPFSAKQLRHTSFALVEVLPDLPEIEESKLKIPEQDLKFEFFRSSGPGGQNVNKVETAVRVIHTPTGLTASSQVERSQVSNREKALKILKAKLFDLMEKTKAKELGELRTKVKPEWGNQIRSYVLNPYKLVKDHRTEVETSNVDKVLEGEIDIFIESEVELLRN
ncbi:MAG: PCRF domain-containing protein [Candidatus Liptonbacteria bacterium]|nr:PCRF domain-containing protein [Candidatus Liptonbacteria bacterium]